VLLPVLLKSAETEMLNLSAVTGVAWISTIAEFVWLVVPQIAQAAQSVVLVLLSETQQFPATGDRPQST